jgi:hypothetical protein
MSNQNLTETQKEILWNAVRRLRKSSIQLAEVIRSGNDRQLIEACATVHAIDTQIRWVRHQRIEQGGPRPEPPVPSHNGLEEDSAPERKADPDSKPRSRLSCCSFGSAKTR